MAILDTILGITLAIGCALSLPIWWWLLVTPLVRFVKWYHTRKRDLSQVEKITPTGAAMSPFDDD
jgi:hypothetical protein